MPAPLVNQPPEILHAVECDDIPVMGIARLHSAGTAHNHQVIPIDHHRGIMPRRIVGRPYRHAKFFELVSTLDQYRNI